MNVMAGSQWQMKLDTCPIAAIKWSNNTSQGMGYIDAFAQSGLFTIQGSDEAGETFTVSGSSKVVTAVSVHVQKVGSPGPLTITLQSGGSTIVAGTIPAGSISTSGTWATLTFPPVTLTSATSYHLFLTSAADASNNYQTWPMQKGIDRGLDVPSEFHDGNYESNGIGDRSRDMQFYFTTQ
jgi:hypothetical protein